ncbi:restriction endonuclease subunit S [Candidatus Saccharibacteria bacterium]|nr:restriction endonuclease subunit S [Candidatus Saccharibacteria bacterium]
MIDTCTWTKFKVSDIFVTEKHGSGLQVPTGAMMSKKDLVEGNIPRVTVSNFNNGITGFYADLDDKNYRTYQNFISVSFLGTVFYQPDKVSLDMKVHCLKPLDYELNVYSAGYIVSIIRKAISNFAYSDQLSSTVLAELEFALPATSDGQPDWDYMESYMKAVMEESEKTLSNLKKADDTKHLIDVSRWGEFRIGDVFDVIKGSRLTKADMRDGVIKFIGSSAINNGETHRIANDEKIHPANTITVCYNGSVGETFYQDERFWASDDVNVLYPKFNMTKLVAMFICPIIKSIGQKYAFIDKWKQEDMKNDIIKLPTTSTGEPDWQYMEKYMKGQFEKSELVIKELRSRI